MSPDDPLDPPEDDYADLEVVSTIRRRAPRVATGRRAADLLPLPPAAAPRPALPEPAVPFPDPIPHILPHGSIATLSGASGVGKTALLAGWLACIQQGQPINGHATNKPTTTGMLAVDRPWRDHRQWFDKAGCEPFPYYALRDDRSFNWNRFRDWKQCGPIFGECLDKIALPPGSLVIVDPLPLFIPGRLNEYKDVAIGLALLDVELQARQLTMLGVFHIAKQKANKNENYLRPQDRILGSGGQIGYSETAMYLMSPDETGKSYYLMGWIPHQLREESFRLQRDPQGLFVPFDDTDYVITEAQEQAAALGCLPDQAATYTLATLVAHICKAINCKDRHARAVLGKLVLQGQVAKVGHGQYQRRVPS